MVLYVTVSFIKFSIQLYSGCSKCDGRLEVQAPSNNTHIEKSRKKILEYSFISAIVSCLLLLLTTGETSDPGHRCMSNVRATGLKYVL
jgi:hypothetical protein